MPKTSIFNKVEQKLQAVIDIGNKGMLSSVFLKNKFVIGCKEGTVFEIDMETLKITKTYKAEMAVNAICNLSGFLEDTFVISQSM